MEINKTLQPPNTLFNSTKVQRIKLDPSIIKPFISPDTLFKTLNYTSNNITSFQFTTDNTLPPIRQGVKVLIIGDSHTVGIYGKELDKLARSQGAIVSTYGVAGSSASWWFNGTKTQCGYFAKDSNGNVQSAGMNQPMPTPDIRELLKKHKPDIVIVSLGANSINSSDTAIVSSTNKLLDTIKSSGAKVYWVGPPNGRASKKDPNKLSHLYNILSQTIGNKAVFIDSRPYTYYPEKGGDGVHFWGKEGEKIAKNWANQVFIQIQNNP